MSLHNYLEKLRAKPVHERKRIAVIATAIGFFIILVIWVVSFNEMNKPAETQVDPTSASLDDLKDNFQDNFQTGKDSIQNMMQELPAPDATLQNPVDNIIPENNSGEEQKNSVPQLP